MKWSGDWLSAAAVGSTSFQYVFCCSIHFIVNYCPVSHCVTTRWKFHLRSMSTPLRTLLLWRVCSSGTFGPVVVLAFVYVPLLTSDTSSCTSSSWGEKVAVLLERKLGRLYLRLEMETFLLLLLGMIGSPPAFNFV